MRIQLQAISSTGRWLLGTGVLLAAIASFSSAGCSDTTNSSSTGSGGSGGSGGSAGAAPGDEEPSYADAFPQDRVPRLDIKIAADQYKLMMDDMTDMLGAFGTGSIGMPGGGGGMPGGGGAGGGGFMPPQEAIDACNGLAAGDACAFTFMNFSLMGTCADMMGTLMCNPSGGPGGGPGGPGGGSADLIPRTPVWVECEVATEDRSWSHVGIRLKGNSSLAMPWMQGILKLPFRIKFDKYEDTYPETKNQRFYGFESLSLSNGSMDQSLLRDKLGTEVFANAGIPAPATAFYRVFIDVGDGTGAKYFGLYTGIELPSDDSFLDSHFGSHKGNLYKPDGTGAQWATYDEASLDKETNEDAADYTDTKSLYEALHADRADAAAWRAGLEKWLDVEGFLHWLALNTVVEDWDTYGRMSHNYYLYGDPAHEGRFAWIPWDHSFAFGGQSGLSLGLAEVTDQWPLIRYLMDDPVYNEKYKGYLAQAVKEYEPVAMEARFTEAHALIAPYVTGAEGEQTGYTFITSAATFDASLPTLIQHVKKRQSDVATFLGP